MSVGESKRTQRDFDVKRRELLRLGGAAAVGAALAPLSTGTARGQTPKRLMQPPLVLWRRLHQTVCHPNGNTTLILQWIHSSASQPRPRKLSGRPRSLLSTRKAPAGMLRWCSVVSFWLYWRI